MRTVEELIEESVSNLGDAHSERDKKRYTEMLSKILIEKIPVSKVIKFTPELIDAIYGHAYRIYNSGNYHEAGVLFAFLTLLDMSNPKYYFGSAACCHKEGNYADAIEYYLASYFLDLTNPIPFYHLYDCWIKMGQKENAFFAVTMVIELSQDNPRFIKIKERSQLAYDNLFKELQIQEETRREKVEQK